MVLLVLLLCAVLQLGTQQVWELLVLSVSLACSPLAGITPSEHGIQKKCSAGEKRPDGSHCETSIPTSSH